MVTLANLEQLEKAPVPMLVGPLRMVTLVRL